MTVPDRTNRARPGRPVFVVRDELPARLAIVVVGAALVVLVVSSTIVSSGEVEEWEADALRFVNGWPDWLEPMMWVLQQVGVLGAPIVAGALIAWRAGRWQYAIPFVVLGPVKLAVEWLILKQLIERGRPAETVGADIIVRGTAHEGLGFPSGHATTAAAFAVLMVAFVPPRWRGVPIVWAVVVGLARLYSGEHNVLDVVAGLAVGTIYAMVLWFAILNRLVEPETGGS